ncbi:hypothetical protein GCM10009087_05030 [Sphingomonas oligophenolica]|uniref:Uncharacterized protein n=1 Tax=Sphingomonas oligophenolica TaxID=301154 RepID=A0ABU9YCC6_9SPHN
MAYIDGKTLIGWGVVRESPWHFVGLFPTQDEAQAKAREMGSGYIVRYGERSDETDSFIFGEPGSRNNVIAGSIFAPRSADDRGDRLAAVAASIDERIDGGGRR